MFKNEKEYLEAKERHDLLSEQVGELNSAKSKLGEEIRKHEYTGWYLYALGVKASVSINILNKSDFEVVGNVHDNPELIFDNMHI